MGRKFPRFTTKFKRVLGDVMELTEVVRDQTVEVHYFLLANSN